MSSSSVCRTVVYPIISLIIILISTSVMPADVTLQANDISQKKVFSIEQWRQSLLRYDQFRKARTQKLRDQMPLAIDKIKDLMLPRLREDNMIIPQNLHYIWLGGPILENYWGALMDMYFIAVKNDYKITIWVDNISNLKKLKTDEGYYKQNTYFNLFNNSQRQLKVKNIKELKNITDEELFFPTGFLKELWHWIDLEQIGLKNLAAASDLLRYLILSYYGGVYLDTDIHSISKPFHPKGDELKNKIGQMSVKYGFLAIPYSNTLLVSTKKHPVLLISLLKAIEQYLKYENRHNYAPPLPSSHISLNTAGAYLSGIDRKRRPYVPQIVTDRLTLTCGISGFKCVQKAILEMTVLIHENDTTISQTEIKLKFFSLRCSPRISGQLIGEQMTSFLDDIKNERLTPQPNLIYKDFLNLMAYEHNINRVDPLKYAKIKEIAISKPLEVTNFIGGLSFRKYIKHNDFQIVSLGQNCYLRYISDGNWLDKKKISYVIDF